MHKPPKKTKGDVAKSNISLFLNKSWNITFPML